MTLVEMRTNLAEASAQVRTSAGARGAGYPGAVPDAEIRPEEAENRVGAASSETWPTGYFVN